MSNTVHVSNEADLNAAIISADHAAPGSFTIDLDVGFTLTADLQAVNLNTGTSLTIDGGSHTIDGDGLFRGLFVNSGSLTLSNLTVADTVARGGAGGAGYYGGGGGAGLGGGLFVAGLNVVNGVTVSTGGAVTLNNVSFSGDAAVGGNGGTRSLGSGDVGEAGAGGGGGMGGDGGASNTATNGIATVTYSGGGGGIGSTARGGTAGLGSPSGYGGIGIVPNAAPGGSSATNLGGENGGGGASGAYSNGYGVYAPGGGGIGGAAGSGNPSPGGFGGGGAYGGMGGFGGGGGGGFANGGAGGFGGGGGGGYTSSQTARGGFGAGIGVGSEGGGGLGAGGAIFVQEGGSVTLGAGTLSGGTATGGASATFNTSTSGAGEGLGAGIFLQGNETITLAPSAGQTLTIGDQITDQSGADPLHRFSQPGAGHIIVDGAGTTTLSLTNNFTGGISLGGGGTLDLAGFGAAGSGAITFNAQATTLRVDAGITVSNIVSHVMRNDAFDARGIVNATASFDTASHNLTISGAGGSLVVQLDSGTYDPTAFTTAADSLPGTGTTVTYTACYCAGTRIRTDTGEVAVEDLAIGDLVMTLDGRMRPVKWIGRRRYARAFAAGNPRIAPVRIAAGALADGVPSRDLDVSPLHAMWLDGVLVPALHLLNGVSITRPKLRDEVHYLHIELEGHDVIFAEGAAAETFIDLDCRAMFHNEAEFAAIYPGAVPAASFAPRLEDGAALEAIRRRLAARAGISPVHAPGVMLGHVERIEGGFAEGWALDADHPHVSVALLMCAGGVVLARVLADRHRDDLERAGHGHGSCAFRVACPEHADIVFRRADDGAVLAMRQREMAA